MENQTIDTLFSDSAMQQLDKAQSVLAGMQDNQTLALATLMDSVSGLVKAFSDDQGPIMPKDVRVAFDSFRVKAMQKAEELI